MKKSEKRLAALKAARDIVTTAQKASRGLTASEKAQIDGHLAEADRLEAEIKAANEDQALLQRLGNLTGPVSTEPDGWGQKTTYGAPANTSAKSGTTYVKGAMEALSKATNELGVKALLTGTVNTPPAVDVVQLPERPSVLLDLIGRAPLTENTFSYLVQTLRDEKAAPVADGQLKPTSVYTFTEKEDRARVIAHLSEPFPLRYMSDHKTMIDVLQSEMVGGVVRALERQVLAGDGTGENFTGLMNTEGVRQVAFTTDMVTTMRKAVTSAQKVGIMPTAWVISADDAEKLDLTREGTEGGFLLGGDVKDRLGSEGVQFIVSAELAAGKAILADWTAATLMVREDTNVLSATQGGELFDHNLVKLRAEGRYGFAVTRPEAFAIVNFA